MRHDEFNGFVSKLEGIILLQGRQNVKRKETGSYNRAGVAAKPFEIGFGRGMQ